MAASSQSPVPTTASRSRCTPGRETAQATLTLEIVGYSLHKGLGQGRSIRSAAFPVGGYQWCILYYPDGDEGEFCKDHVSVALELLTRHVEVRASSLVFSLINPATGHPASSFSSVSKLVFGRETARWGVRRFKRRSKLEAPSRLLRGDRLVIECEIDITKEPLDPQVPPSDLIDNLGRLLEGRRGADVTFSVQGEVFPAHKAVLAMRSRVFDAEFYGPMARDGRREEYITIEDMQPIVFRAFLHFVYTDSLPSMDDLGYDDMQEMVKHLLAAADRYAMERMKLLCERILCKSLGVENVATTLAIADQHHCSRLKDACVKFITSKDHRIDDVLASQGYGELKRSCPAVVVDVFESSKI